MNIGMVLANIDFPPDIRVEKEARSLIAAGHRVFLLCLRTGKELGSPVWNGIRILRISPLPLLLRKLNSLLYVVSMRDMQWKGAIRTLVEKRAIDVIHVHDLPMVGTALAAARAKRLPVIADLHENYAALVELGVRRGTRRLAAPFLGAGRWQRLETRWAKSCARILVVVEEAKERLLAEGIPPKQVTVVENTVDVEHFLSLPIDDGVVRRFDNQFVIGYAGGFSRHRGLDVAVKAMPRILRRIPNARLLLVGEGEMMPQLRTLSEATGVARSVLFTGWQEFRRMPSYIAASDVCIVPHASNDHTEATAPHKLYQYMAMGKPVVVSSCGPLRRVVEGARCGLVFEAGDADSFACCIAELNDPALRARLGGAARDAVLRTFNWKKSAEKLLGVYDDLARTSA